ncbi:MAG: hypothetical protein LW628_11610, partial [Fimbriimonadaceae bacterium]|nr:hypothetical protein [Fimbriimonadaceae bacterium]
MPVRQIEEGPSNPVCKTVRGLESKEIDPRDTIDLHIGPEIDLPKTRTYWNVGQPAESDPIHEERDQ